MVQLNFVENHPSGSHECRNRGDETTEEKTVQQMSLAVDVEEMESEQSEAQTLFRQMDSWLASWMVVVPPMRQSEKRRDGRVLPDAVLFGHWRAHWWVPARTPTIRGPTSRSVSSDSSTQKQRVVLTVSGVIFGRTITLQKLSGCFPLCRFDLFLTFCGGRCVDVAVVVLSFVFRGDFFGFVRRRIIMKHTRHHGRHGSEKQ